MKTWNLFICWKRIPQKGSVNFSCVGKAENKSWYDSKVIPYIDDGGASLDNLYLPENAIQEVVWKRGLLFITTEEPL